ncbi:TPA: LCP family protein [Enterococcus faecium]|uniref:LCP family glycopolymer transferase n=1 Tax=Enterococcus faecium TaxID=1352 RepID=UPI00032DC54F|nr:LCP family protein [Enterococcus faecium]EMF0416318.1 LCP family protein [Enterococcus faecium]EOK69485.1 hypothetical protein SE5_01126 [Enterococcus faecium EnGen0125]EOK75020.1 hypothetical protein SGY_01627 [Enterococcus faecium EnGen0145]KAA9132931.1 transcriptional regulator [Enterococcus faecium]KAA9136100.1 transcriptional regulator [Enterococcus faecium]
MSTGKKIILGIVGLILAITLVVVGLGAKVYFDVRGSADQTYESVKRKNPAKREQAVDLEKQNSFSVLLLGIDTGDLGRTEQGRSDTMMVATVNPKDKKTTIVSIARDTYVPIVGHGTDDKINHAYAFGGAAMSMDTVESYLDIPMDGDRALAFSRMRKEDPRGDYGRQERQRAIVVGVVKQLLSMDGITKYQEVLEAMESNVTTDMHFADMKKIALNYRDAFTNVKTEQMQGEGFMQDNISYQRVSEDELKRVQDILKGELDF